MPAFSHCLIFCWMYSLRNTEKQIFSEAKGAELVKQLGSIESSNVTLEAYKKLVTYIHHFSVAKVNNFLQESHVLLCLVT